MTPATFRTLREACGLSQQDAASFLGVAIRTIAHWETGRNSVPAGAAADLQALNDRIEAGVRNVLALAAELSAQHGQPDDIVLTRYRSADDYQGSRADQEGLLWPCHNAMLARAMVALRRQGRAVALAYAQVQG
ncbi:MAG TPA: helix-turn-helix domain-containing protein [Gammaproteobacteria bacterium]|nr:helix-turn-helix domain-containing protein [Gammaproteobacteria bacterium]